MEKALNNHVWNSVAEVELIYKSKVKASERPRVLTPEEALALLRQSWDENKIEFIEQFKVLYLSQASRALGIYEVSSGGLTTTDADIRLVFIAALKLKACSMIVCHYVNKIVM